MSMFTRAGTMVRKHRRRLGSIQNSPRRRSAPTVLQRTGNSKLLTRMEEKVARLSIVSETSTSSFGSSKSTGASASHRKSISLDTRSAKRRAKQRDLPPVIEVERIVPLTDGNVSPSDGNPPSTDGNNSDFTPVQGKKRDSPPFGDNQRRTSIHVSEDKQRIVPLTQGNRRKSQSYEPPRERSGECASKNGPVVPTSLQERGKVVPPRVSQQNGRLPQSLLDCEGDIEVLSPTTSIHNDRQLLTNTRVLLVKVRYYLMFILDTDWRSRQR